MAAKLHTDRFDGILLAYLGTRKKPPSGEIFAKFWDHWSWTSADGRPLRPLVQERVSALCARGHLNPDRTLSDEGRQFVAGSLGVKPGQPWQSVKNRAVAHALEVEPQDAKANRRIATASGLRAHLLASELDLATGAHPTLKQVKDAICWRAFGIESGEPFSIKALLRLVLSQQLGRADGDTRLDPDKLISILSARTVGATTGDANKLRMAVTQQWLAGKEAPGPSAEADQRVEERDSAELTQKENSEPLHPVRAQPEEPGSFGVVIATNRCESPPTVQQAPGTSARPSLPLFAARVQEVADREFGDGRFGDRKVFIAAVWACLSDDPIFAALGLREFKRLLGDANREGLLRLHRADLVAAMDAELVEASEATYLNATFHFVESVPRSATR